MEEREFCIAVGICSLEVFLKDEASFSVVCVWEGVSLIRLDEGGSILSRLLVLLLSV